MPVAPVVTTTATAAAQGTPNASAEPVKTAAPVATPEAKPAAPAAEAKPKEAAQDAKVEAGKETKPKVEVVDPGAEVKYDIQLPKETKLAPEEVDAIKDYAKAWKMSPDQAQGIASFVDAQREHYRTQAEGAWLEECKDHPKYGKEKFPAACENIKRFLERTAPKLIGVLDQSGYANKVEVFEFLADMASRGVDDSLVQGKQTVTPDNRSALQKLEDSLNEKYKTKKG